ncbi:hypothetical protein RA813_002418 [Vibrio parahaemolyticus]|nr:hypothetical protein [Vibrio parahaemolyticus]EHR0247462.1 hypothetical protein [Vibrio parahaemolyticus]EJU9123935.1 hypothetical protein [Vibrio parahaemolyticus]ELA7027577.1 hypothetical protein [Vibrio parahaemolyticus]HCE4911640.1 hypothetical protein [Vibrio parahaemolyticus]
MKIPKHIFEESRVELAAMGFRAALNLLRRKTDWDEVVSIRYLAKQTKNIEEVFFQAKDYGVPNYLIEDVIKALDKKGVRFYKHQLSPTLLIIENHALEKIYRASNG